MVCGRVRIFKLAGQTLEAFRSARCVLVIAGRAAYATGGLGFVNVLTRNARFATIGRACSRKGAHRTLLTLSLVFVGLLTGVT